MKQNKNNRFAALLLALCMAVCCALPALAAPAASANIDLSRTGSMDVTLYDHQNDVPLRGGALTVYKVADVARTNGDLHFVYTADFTGCGIALGDLTDSTLASRLEAKLPAALSTRAAALALSVVVMLAAFVGFGGAKVRGKYNEARQWFTTGVSADNGYALSEELTTRANTAANIITTGANTLGADSAEVQAAQAALDDFSACLEAVQNGSKKQSLTSLPYYQGSAMHALCQANEALGTVIDQLYAKMQEQAADPMKMGAVQGQYGQFNSADTIIGNLQYNDAVYEYQNDVGGFPASMLGRLFGVQEVEPFA